MATLALACGDDGSSGSSNSSNQGAGGTTTGGNGGTAGDGGETQGGGGAGATGGGGMGGMGGSGGVFVPEGDKLDVLLVIDNSRSMADKQAILGDTVSDLVTYFSNPRCVDMNGVAQGQPATPNDPCPSGQTRQFKPLQDIHFAVMTSSLGGLGSDACAGNGSPSENDQGRLIDRSGTGQGDPPVPTHQNLGFLAWSPNGDTESSLAQIINGAGEVGCGYESTLEAWYRFLVDPLPYDSITLSMNTALLNGTDNVILQQRADFLRPDSTLMIMMVSDENDCSTRAGGQFFFARQIFQPGTNTPYHLPPPRAACAIDPNDPCCRSCGQAPGAGCDTSNDNCSSPLPNIDDNINLRCFDQKRRFGIDFLWPIDRYATGLSATMVPDHMGAMHANPLFTGSRTPAEVFVTSLVGVPFQDVARRDLNGTPDITQGLMSAAELTATNTWDVIVGDPANDVDATDPHMVESYDPRSGSNPITGDMLQPPGSAFLADPINGHEFTIAQRDDLQYACIFPLDTPRDCSMPGQSGCDCTDPSNDKPVCQDPQTNAFGTTQYYAKAYPGRRHLQLMQTMGNQGIVGSICPAQLSDPALTTFGYRPTLAAMADAAAGTFEAP